MTRPRRRHATILRRTCQPRRRTATAMIRLSHGTATDTPAPYQHATNTPVPTSTPTAAAPIHAVPPAATKTPTNAPVPATATTPDANVEPTPVPPTATATATKRSSAIVDPTTAPVCYLQRRRRPRWRQPRRPAGPRRQRLDDPAQRDARLASSHSHDRYRAPGATRRQRERRHDQGCTRNRFVRCRRIAVSHDVPGSAGSATSSQPSLELTAAWRERRIGRAGPSAALRHDDGRPPQPSLKATPTATGTATPTPMYALPTAHPHTGCNPHQRQPDAHGRPTETSPRPLPRTATATAAPTRRRPPPRPQRQPTPTMTPPHPHANATPIGPRPLRQASVTT